MAVALLYAVFNFTLFVFYGVFYSLYYSIINRNSY
jgi:hypothetical protein